MVAQFGSRRRSLRRRERPLSLSAPPKALTGSDAQRDHQTKILGALLLWLLARCRATASRRTWTALYRHREPDASLFCVGRQTSGSYILARMYLRSNEASRDASAARAIDSAVRGP